MTWRTGSDDVDAGRFSLLDAARQDALGIFSGATSWPDTGALTANVYGDRDDLASDAGVSRRLGWPTESPASLRTRIYGYALSNVTFVCTSTP